MVSAAAGSVGSIVGQIARIKGCKTVGIAGGEAKCALLVRELGFDGAVDYKAGNTRRALREACPDGIDVYFDNVGGDVLEACLFNMNTHGRIACCGAVSQYDGAAPAAGPRGVPGLIVTKRLTLRGFIVSDFDAQREAALDELEDWVESGKLTVHEDVMQGLETLPQALIGLLAATTSASAWSRSPERLSMADEADVFYPLTTDTWGEVERAAAIAVIESGRTTMGDKVRAFETTFAAMVGARHAVMVNSGSSANLLAVAALFQTREPLARAGRVAVVPAVSWATTYYPLSQYGLTLRFVDVDPARR